MDGSSYLYFLDTAFYGPPAVLYLQHNHWLTNLLNLHSPKGIAINELTEACNVGHVIDCLKLMNYDTIKMAACSESNPGCSIRERVCDPSCHSHRPTKLNLVRPHLG